MAITQKDKLRAVRLYYEGVTFDRIEEETGVRRQHVHILLRQMGLKANRKKDEVKHLRNLRYEMWLCYERGDLVADICERFQVRPRTVYRAVGEFGKPLRSPRKAKNRGSV